MSSLTIEAFKSILNVLGWDRDTLLQMQQLINAKLESITPKIRHRVVLNKGRIFFGLSIPATDLVIKIKRLRNPNPYNTEVLRDDPALVLVVEKLGREASADWSWLEVCEIDVDINHHYVIDESSGYEMFRVVEGPPEYEFLPLPEDAEKIVDEYLRLSQLG